MLTEEAFILHGASGIREVAEQGHRGAALGQSEKLWTLVRTSVDAGVSEESLAHALATTRDLLEELGASPG